MSTRSIIAVDPSTNDFYLDNTGNLAMVYDAEAVGQHGRMRLQTFTGEWFLDQAVGVPWLSDILGKQYNPALSESVVKVHLLETDGIVSIDTFDISFAKQTRGLIIRNVSVKTVYDEAVKL